MVRIPKLRFPEFKGEWEENITGKILYRYTNPVLVEPDIEYKQIGVRSHCKGIFYKAPVLGDELGKKRVFWLDKNLLILNIVFAWEQAIAKTTSLEIGYIASHRFPMFRCVDGVLDLDFIVRFFSTKKGKRLLELASPGGAGRNKTLGQKEFERLKLTIPLLSEQQKIASFLLKIDERLDLLRKKYTTLQRYKKGVMQQIFSQQIRFKQDDGSDFPEWKIVKLRDVLKERKERNLNNTYYEVFSVAKKQGVINQIEHLGRSYASSNISNYKVLRPSDIVYTKSPTSHFPYGIIKQNQTQRIGVVSVLYAVFIPENKHLGYLLHSYFLSCINTYNYLNSLVQKGAKNTININNTDFLNGADFALPESVVEQQKIAIFLSNLDQQLEVLNQQIKENERYKKGLLQEMFV